MAFKIIIFLIEYLYKTNFVETKILIHDQE